MRWSLTSSALKDKAKEGLVTDQVFENLSQAWQLPCDGSVDEAEYEEGLRMILKRDAAKREWLGHDITRGRVAGALCACCDSSSSGIERRKGERPSTSGCWTLIMWSCGGQIS